MKYTLAIYLSLILSGCLNEDSFELEENVHFEIVQYFHRFEDEATLRGMSIDWSQEEISADIVTIDEDAVGRCITFDNGSREIRVDSKYWNQSDELEREFLIFHELGHCLLSRSHLNSQNVDGTCTSMMNSGESRCQKNYNNETRDEYIDELFS